MRWWWPTPRTPGLSGARNTGVSHATGDVVVFLDDDACPEPGWLDAYRRAFVDPTCQVVGGAVEPVLGRGPGPAWFPDEFGWVVGCDYRGLPGRRCRGPQPDRRQHGHQACRCCNGSAASPPRSAGSGRSRWAARRPICASGSGRPTPAAVDDPQHRAAVRQSVSADRRRLAVLPVQMLLRGPLEGRALRPGRDAATVWPANARYVTTTLPTGVLRGFRSGLAGRLAGPLRSLAITAGFGATAVGFLSARLRTRLDPRIDAGRDPHRPNPGPTPGESAADRAGRLRTGDRWSCRSIGSAEPTTR